MWNPDKYQAAILFAAQAHLGQTFAGQELPYLVHLAQVTMEVMRALCQESEGLDADLAVQCALLHDTLEDTDTTYAELASHFGEAVAQGVQALGKNPDLPKTERMADSLQRILKLQRREVAMVKLADRITNLQQPPAHWSREKKRAYQAEALVILSELGAAHAWLAQRLADKIEAYTTYLEGEI